VSENPSDQRQNYWFRTDNLSHYKLLNSNGRLSSKCIIRTKPSSISRDGYLVQQCLAHCNPLVGPAHTINYAMINSECSEEELNDSTILATAACGNRQSCIEFSRGKRTQGGIKSPFHFKKLDILQDTDAAITWIWIPPLRNAVRRSDHGAGEIFWTRPHRPWGPPCLLYNGCRVSFLGVKWPGRGDNHPHPPTAKVEESRDISLLPFWAFIACPGVNFYLVRCSFFTLRYHSQLEENHYSAPQYAI